MGSPTEFAKLAQSAGFAGQHDTMMVAGGAVNSASRDPKKVNGMLQALASGNTDDFVNQAKALGLDPKQAQHAVRDTAALAALVVQFADVACW